MNRAETVVTTGEIAHHCFSTVVYCRCVKMSGKMLLLFNLENRSFLEGQGCVVNIASQLWEDTFPSRVLVCQRGTINYQRQVIVKYLKAYLSRPTRKPTSWPLRNVSTRIGLRVPRRLTRIDTFRLLWIFSFRNHHCIPLSPRDGMCQPGSVCAECAVWSGLIHYAESMM